jgi:DNA polymerase elongation subunit (family B)
MMKIQLEIIMKSSKENSTNLEKYDGVKSNRNYNIIDFDYMTLYPHIMKSFNIPSHLYNPKIGKINKILENVRKREIDID